jgi:glutamyl/glutaminyl-tRNA synthetase
MINFIASLGWNDGTEQELYSTANLIDRFSLDRVQSSGARFDEQRLLWMNGAHIRELTIDTLYQKSEGFWPEEAANYDENYKKNVLRLVQERLKYLAELPDLTRLFFVDLPVNEGLISNHKQLSKMTAEELKNLLMQARESLSQSDFTTQDLTKRLNDLLVTTAQKPVVLFSLIRIATTQAAASPGLVDTLALLGKERSMQRIDVQLGAF